MQRAEVDALLTPPDTRGRGTLPFFEWDPVPPELLGPDQSYELWTWRRCPTVYNVFFGIGDRWTAGELDGRGYGGGTVRSGVLKKERCFSEERIPNVSAPPHAPEATG